MFDSVALLVAHVFDVSRRVSMRVSMRQYILYYLLATKDNCSEYMK